MLRARAASELVIVIIGEGYIDGGVGYVYIIYARVLLFSAPRAELCGALARGVRVAAAVISMCYSSGVYSGSLGLINI